MRIVYRIGRRVSKFNLAPTCNITSIISFRKGLATRECKMVNTRDAVRDGNGGKGGATRESTNSNTRYAIDCAVMDDSIGDCGGSETIVVTPCYFHSCFTGDIVVQIT